MVRIIFLFPEAGGLRETSATCAGLPPYLFGCASVRLGSIWDGPARDAAFALMLHRLFSMHRLPFSLFLSCRPSWRCFHEFCLVTLLPA